MLQVGNVSGYGGLQWTINRYPEAADDILIVNWKEMVLIRAEIAGSQGAIDLVNQLRAADDLPLVTYADPSNEQQICYMIFEERRRALSADGRFFYTKLLNTAELWFPRALGRQEVANFNYFGGVRFLMPRDEYVLNENLSLSDRATGCPVD